MYRPAGWSCSKWNLHETAGYGAPVAWAVKNGITKGVGSVLFAPLQMKRGTMPLWVQECPDCGYTAGDVSDATQIPREYLQSEAYQSCGGIRFAEDLAGRFYRQHLILLWDQ